MIEVTAWQSVDAICHCCPTPSSCVEVTGPISSGYSSTAMEASACQKRLSLVPMPSPHNLQCVLDQCVCSMHIISYKPDSQFLCCTFCVIFSGLRFSMTIMYLQLLHVLHMDLLTLAPQCCHAFLILTHLSQCMTVIMTV